MSSTGKQFKMVVKALIRDGEGNVLIIRKKGGSQSGYWDLPGGRVGHGESVDEALSRELKEECDMTLLSVGNILHVSGFLARGNPQDHVFGMIYACKAKGGITLGKEHSEYKWVAPKKLSRYQFPKDGYLETFKTLQ